MENQKLIIPFTENDVQELGAGEEFNWTFTTDKGEDIDILIRLETEEDIENNQ